MLREKKCSTGKETVSPCSVMRRSIRRREEGEMRSKYAVLSQKKKRGNAIPFFESFTDGLRCCRCRRFGRLLLSRRAGKQVALRHLLICAWFFLFPQSAEANDYVQNFKTLGDKNEQDSKECLTKVKNKKCFTFFCVRSAHRKIAATHQRVYRSFDKTDGVEKNVPV
jgi:hypothetical protein